MKNIQDTFDRVSYKPIRLNTKQDFKKQLKKYIAVKGSFQVIDQYEIQLEEVFLLRNPKYRFNKNYRSDFDKFASSHAGKAGLVNAGSWFYFPWMNCVIHYLSDAMHQEVRTGRNRNLITKAEQDKYYNSTVGILGMSVGSHVALTIVMTGGAKHIKLADLDVLSASNLNRVRTGFQNIEVPKVVAVARQIYEMNPYAKVELYQKGITEQALHKFLVGSGKLSLLVEEMDQPYFKIKVREEARKLGIPIIMAADNADSIVVDVERFDINKKYPILHGILGKMTAEEFRHVEPKDLPKVIAKMAGANLSTVRMLQSVMEVGNTIYSWPQLGNAATLCGAVLTYLAREIILKAKVPSGRTDFNVGTAFMPLTAKEKKQRDKIFKMMGIK